MYPFFYGPLSYENKKKRLKAGVEQKKCWDKKALVRTGLRVEF